MLRSLRRPAALLLVLLLVAPAGAVIKKLTPLKEVLDSEDLIFILAIEKVDPDKPSATFTLGDQLKGKAPFDRITLNLTGDAEAKREKQTQILVDRLGPTRKAVVFASKQGNDYSAFVFVDGTWFQMKGTKDGEAYRWAFLHCEPYFRRTFKGTTADLTATAKEYLANKKAPPGPDEKEPPGYGPPVEKKCVHVGGPLFAVIPSFVLIGPLAILAALFPSVFAPLAIGLKRWRALLIVASANSTLALAYFWLREYLPDTRWFGPTAIGGYLLIGTLIGLVWSGRRYRQAAAIDPTITAPPMAKEVLALAGATLLVSVMVAGTGWWAGWHEVLLAPWKEFTGVAVGLGLATVYAGYRFLTPTVDGNPPPNIRLSLPGETIALVGVLAFAAITIVPPGTRDPAPTLTGELGEAANTDNGLVPKLIEAKVLFETTDFHEVMSAVNVQDNRIYVGAAKQTGFRSSGAVLALDRTTGQEVWRFTDDGALKPVFARPAVANGVVFAGEGLHTDADRRLFALAATTGKPAWPTPVTTTSHTEGSPRVVDGKVYFAAGDDGLYCVAAADGKELWHTRGAEQQLHIDTPPAVAGGRVFFGSGYKTWALLAADAATGAELWRVPVSLRSFGAPLTIGRRVVFGLGTGNLTEDLAAEIEPGHEAEKEAKGAVICLDGATGGEIWRYDLPKSCHTALAADGRSVYAACRDGTLYALDQATGKLRWKRSVGAAFTAGPALASFARGAVTLAVYAVSQDGRVVCLNPLTGEMYWFRDLKVETGRDVNVLSTPVIVSPESDGGRRQIYFGAMLSSRNSATKSAAVIRIEDAIEE